MWPLSLNLQRLKNENGSNFESVDKKKKEMRPLKWQSLRNFPAVLLVMLWKVVIILESVDDAF